MAHQPASEPRRTAASGRTVRLLAAVSVPALALAVYFVALRPALLHWGATPEEITCPMPGDDLIAHPNFVATRAITIDAPPEAIWPWLAQMGYRRAGFYGYDLIENIGAPGGIRSATSIQPELQHPKPGDMLPISGVAHLIFGSVVPDRYLIWRSEAQPADGVFTWALDPVEAHHSRLISRIRLRYHWRHAWLLSLDLFTEFTDHVAVPAILQGIQARVEGRPPEPLWVEALEILVCLLAMAELAAALVCIFRWAEWLRAWLLACACAALLMTVLYAHLPVWAGGLLVSAAAVELVWMDRRCARRSRAA